jgi:hypothetical protein
LPNHRLSVTAIWSDVDLIEVDVAVIFQEWAGCSLAYATRDDLRAFARDLVAVVEGATAAELNIGQPDLGYATCRVFEYDRARHLCIEVRVGHAGEQTINRPDFRREVHITVPVERGQLSSFASELQNVITAETGNATLSLLAEWP